MTRKGAQAWDGIQSAVRQAWRSLLRTPGVTAAVVLTLGSGIGVNAAMFGIVDRLLLRPPEHIADPAQVRRVLREGEWWGPGRITPSMTYPDLVDLRTIPEFASAGGFTEAQTVTLGLGGEARRVTAVQATFDFFTTLGVHAEQGRFFGADEDRLDANLTAVVSHELWASSLGRDPGILGRSLELSGQSVTVIGVAPPGFTGVDLAPVDLWLPTVAWTAVSSGRRDFVDSRQWWWLRAVVRVTDEAGVGAGEAKATALHVNARSEEVARGDFDGDARIFTSPLLQARGPSASGESKVAQWLAGVSLIVLLIACANVTNLLLAQGAERRREVAVRLALGVSSGRLVREMVLEALLLSALGGAAALAIAQWGGGAIRGVLIPEVSWGPTVLDVRVVAFTALLALAAGLLAGLGPALQSTRADLARDLAEGSRGNVQTRSSLRGALTVAQGALSVVLLVGAGLFIRSLGEVRGLDIGIDADRLAMVRLEFSGERPDAAEKTRVYEEAARIARGLPGATAAATSETLFGWSRMGNITVPGYDSLPVPTGAGPFYYGVSPQYLGTVGLRLLQGRPILETDVEGTPSVAVVNETMARTLWPSGDAVGACFHVRGTEDCTTVVGVVEDAARWSLADDTYLAYYLPLAQQGSAPEGLYVRTEGDPHALAAALAPALRSFSPEVRFAEVQAFTEILDPQMRSWTLGATLFTAFGALALLVAAIGLYSLLAFDVTRQTREIGIRSALGATKTTILRGVVVNAVRLGAMGIALGLAAAAAAAPLVQDLLFQVEPRELRVMGAVAALLLAVALLASAVPALRATRVDPMEALRMD